jgi:dephospho-CoA kinase
MKRSGSVALTGGIACGKSEAASFLAAAGVPVLDTDAVGHELLSPDHWIFEKLVQTFGRGCLDAHEAGIDRKKLGAIVFRDAEARATLNAIMHPVIYRRVDEWLDEALDRQTHAVVMIPLLYETGAESRFETVLVVASNDAIVRSRLAARGLNAEEIELRLAAQLPLSEKVSRAHGVIWNNEDLETLKGNTMRVWRAAVLGKE